MTEQSDTREKSEGGTDDAGVYHVLIYASKKETQHKFLGPLDPGDRAYWTVNGTPQKVQLRCRVFFHDGKVIYAEGMVTEVEDGRIWFTPLESVRLDHPDRPDGAHQGFKYISGLPPKTTKHLPKDLRPDGGEDAREDDDVGVEQRRDLFIEYQVAEEGFYRDEVEQMLADGEIEVPEWWYEIDLPTCEYTECGEEATKKFKIRHGANGPYSVSKRCPLHYPEWKGTGGVEWEKNLATEPTIADKTEQQTLVTDGGHDTDAREVEQSGSSAFSEEGS